MDNSSRTFADPGTRRFDEWLVKLQAPQTLDEFTGLLTLLEEELSDPLDCSDQAGAVVSQLISTLRFYALVLASQHMLIRDLRRMLERTAAVQ